MPKTYTVKQVAQALGFSTNTVYKYLEEGKIKATRLGSEGRFRIPGEEVARLLGDRTPAIVVSAPNSPQAEPAQSNPSLPVTSTTPPALESSSLQDIPSVSDTPSTSLTPNSYLNLLKRVFTPDLFSWFLALTSIFTSVSYFLYPIYYQNPLIVSFQPLILITHILIGALGILLIASDLFFSSTKLHHHLLARIPLAVCFGGLSILFFASSELLNFCHYLTLGLFTLSSSFSVKHPGLKLHLFSLTLLLSTFISFLSKPSFSLFLHDFRYEIELNGTSFLVKTILPTVIGYLTLFFGYFKHAASFNLASIAIGIVFFLRSLDSLNTKSWDLTVINLMVSSFSFILPFQSKLDNVARFTRRQVLISFTWLVVILMIGLIVVQVTQFSSQQSVLSTNTKSLSGAKNLIEYYLRDDTYLLSTASTKIFDPNLHSALVESLYRSSSILHQVLIANTDGTVLASYPLQSGQNESLGKFTYFAESIQSNKAVFSKSLRYPTQSSPPSIHIAFPIVQSDSVSGAVVGIVDMEKLSTRLNSFKPGEKGYFSLSDPDGILLIHPDPNLLGNATKSEAIRLASNQKSGQGIGYSESGVLSLQSYAPISFSNWRLIAEQPYSDASNNSSTISFSIFLVTIISGVGTLAFTSFANKNRHEE